MNRTTGWMMWVGVGGVLSVLLYGMYWFYRVPVGALDVADDDFVSAGVPRDGVPSIDTPNFESVAAADVYLKDDGYGLDVEVGGDHRFYPYQILVWHEVVNDEFDGEMLAVTFDPLTFTGIVFERTVDPSTGSGPAAGEALTFGTSGKLWNNNLLMQDRKTSSLWSQVLGKAMSGEMVGKSLARYPALTMRWTDFKRAFPNGDVLSRETGADRDYTRDPYGNYLSSPAVLFPLTSTDSRLTSKTLVYGVTVGDAHAVYPVDIVVQLKEIRDTVGGVPVEIAYDEELGAARAFRLKLDGEQGEPLPIETAFWFIWAAAFADVQVYQLP